MLEEFDYVVLSKIFSYLSLYNRLTVSCLNKQLHNKIVTRGGLLIHNLTIHSNVLKISKYFCKYKALANGITEIYVIDNSNIDLSMFPKVKKLYLRYGISNCNLKDMAYLEMLMLYESDIFKLERIYAILMNCTKLLTFINLHGQVNVNSEILHFIVNNFPNLKYLDVSWCTAILAKDFSLLRKKCTKLESLAMFSCECIYEDDYKFFKTNLKYFDDDLVEVIVDDLVEVNHKRLKI